MRERIPILTTFAGQSLPMLKEHLQLAQQAEEQGYRSR